MKVVIDPRNPLQVYDLEGNLIFEYKGLAKSYRIEDLQNTDLNTLGLSDSELEQVKELLEKRKRTQF